MEKTPCGNCGSVSYYKWRKTLEAEMCSDCTKLADNTPRDAVGQPVRIPTHLLGKYSYATDCVLNSDRQYAALLRREGLGQKKG